MTPKRTDTSLRVAVVAIVAVAALASINIDVGPCTPPAPTGFAAIWDGTVVRFAWNQDPTGCARGYAIAKDGRPYASVPDAAFWADPLGGPGERYSVAGIAPDQLMRLGPSSADVVVP